MSRLIGPAPRHNFRSSDTQESFMAFFQENRGAREPFLNAPPAVLWLIAFLLLTHAARILLPGNLPDDVLERYAFIPARYAIAAHQGIGSRGFLDLAVPF